ncbi:hypothetical protein IKF88_02065 [Candidatus Saccharibacteria bacterium]|nr:hypothetical protein [Candidatus Saccharibacteria bacterium]MBR3254492.1 hypothetical protein [Candidatus Saccharibacteria bacterium]
MNWRKWCDEFLLAGKGILLATREKRFWIGFVISFLFFGMLMNLLSGGFSKFELMAATGFSGSMKILADALLGVFGYKMIVSEWLSVFAIAVLQGTLIGLVVLLWQKKRVSKNSDTSNSANVEKVGIITGLIALGAGCPTCGTTLITPLLGAIFSTGGLAATGVISGVVTALAIIIAVLSLKRIGEETYVIIVNEKYLRKKEEREKGA